MDVYFIKLNYCIERSTFLVVGGRIIVMKKIHDFYFPEWDTHFETYFTINFRLQILKRLL